MNLSSKVAIVTGAAGQGIGRSTALTLARQGASVVVNYRESQDSAEAICSSIIAAGGHAISIKADVFTQDGCEALVNDCIGAFGKVDICVIGPGAGWNPQEIDALDPAKSTEDVMQEIAPIYNLMPPLLADMKKRRWGRIIAIASNMHLLSPSYSYNTAKACRIQAIELAAARAWNFGITVNAVAPGPVNPLGSLDEALAQAASEDAYHHRTNLSPQDIAETIAFLSSGRADYITGCIIPFMFK